MFDQTWIKEINNKSQNSFFLWFFFSSCSGVLKSSCSAPACAAVISTRSPPTVDIWWKVSIGNVRTLLKPVTGVKCASSSIAQKCWHALVFASWVMWRWKRTRLLDLRGCVCSEVKCLSQLRCCCRLEGFFYGYHCYCLKLSWSNCGSVSYIDFRVWAGLKWAGLHTWITVAWKHKLLRPFLFDASLLPDVRLSGCKPIPHLQSCDPSWVELWTPRMLPSCKGHRVAALCDAASLSLPSLRRSLSLICKAVTLACDWVKACDDIRGPKWFAATNTILMWAKALWIILQRSSDSWELPLNITTAVIAGQNYENTDTQPLINTTHLPLQPLLASSLTSAKEIT